jgi:hypothetical protein
MRKPYEDLTGKTFGRLRVLTRYGSRQKQPLWECECECRAKVYAVGSSLRNGYTTSCGCKRREFGRAKRTHGMEQTPEYRSWLHMKGRCLNPTDDDFPKYGGRGIRVCDRWQRSFVDFLEDMGQRPSTRHSLDRINNDGHYEPGNCRWATKHQQNRNKRNVRLFNIGGATLTTQDVAAMCGIKWKTLNHRLRQGMTIHEAIAASAFHSSR